jgi:putative two-component system response regulator
LGQSLYIVSMSQEKPVLLLVENDPLSLSLYDRELNPDYSILTCKNEADASFALKNGKVSLIILEPASGNDWVWDLLKQVKMKEETAKIPVIFCSVLDEKKKGLEQGASAYLIKPVYANVLRQYVQELLKT